MSKNLELGDRDMGENSFRCQLERQPGIVWYHEKPYLNDAPFSTVQF